MGIYLPMAPTLLIPLGAVLGWFYNRWAARSQSPEFAERMGVLMATGLIVGESLMGVVYARPSPAPKRPAQRQRQCLRWSSLSGGDVVSLVVFARDRAGFTLDQGARFGRPAPAMTIRPSVFR